jgi:zinc-ribbon domain
MYCPQCGQQQASSEMRFCSRCGFPLGGVTELLANGGVLQSTGGEELREQALSPRRRGIKRGVVMMLVGTVVVPVLGILNSYQEKTTMLEVLVAISAIIFFAGGLMRILYSLLFEASTPNVKLDAPADIPSATPAQLDARTRVSALPPAQSIPAPSFASRRMNTAELRQPSSVTENTTRLLDEEQAKRNE